MEPLTSDGIRSLSDFRWAARSCGVENLWLRCVSAVRECCGAAAEKQSESPLVLLNLFLIVSIVPASSVVLGNYLQAKKKCYVLCSVYSLVHRRTLAFHAKGEGM